MQWAASTRCTAQKASCLSYFEAFLQPLTTSHNLPTTSPIKKDKGSRCMRTPPPPGSSPSHTQPYLEMYWSSSSSLIFPPTSFVITLNPEIPYPPALQRFKNQWLLTFSRAFRDGKLLPLITSCKWYKRITVTLIYLPNDWSLLILHWITWHLEQECGTLHQTSQCWPSTQTQASFRSEYRLPVPSSFIYIASFIWIHFYYLPQVFSVWQSSIGVP